MSRESNWIEYEEYSIACDLCKKEEMLDNQYASAPDGWIETTWNYKIDDSDAPKNAGIATGAAWVNPGFKQVAFCCKEHMDTWFITHPQGMTVKLTYLVFGGQ